MAIVDTTRLIDRMVAQATEQMVPLRVIFEVTYRCNHACSFCYLSRHSEPELSTEECKRVLSELKQEGCLFVTLTGGEPLARPDLFEIAAYARELGLALELKTNGTMIDRENAKLLKELSVLNVDISLHASHAALHDEATRVRGSFDAAVRGIRLLRDEAITVTVKCPLTRRNFDDREAIKSLCEELGCDCVFDLSLTARQDGDLSPHMEKITEGQLEQFISCHEQDYLATVLDCVGPAELAEMREMRPCSAGVSTASINPYGEVYPCIQLFYTIGNVRRQSFCDIWRHSAVLEKLRRVRFADLTACGDCADVAYCLRCPGLALLEDGDLLGRSSEACRQATAYRRVRETNGSVGADI